MASYSTEILLGYSEYLDYDAASPLLLAHGEHGNMNALKTPKKVHTIMSQSSVVSIMRYCLRG